MKSALITAMFNIGIGGAIALLHRKEAGVGRELLVSVLLVSWALTRIDYE